MIVAGISALLGAIGGALPKALDIWQEKSETALELKRLEKEAEISIKLVKIQSDLRLTELNVQREIEEGKQYQEQLNALYKLQAKPSGIKWIDGFNSIIRPATAALAMAVGFVIMGMYSVAVLEQVSKGVITMEAASHALWNSMVGEVVQAALGWMFGYRSTAKFVK